MLRTKSSPTLASTIEGYFSSGEASFIGCIISTTGWVQCLCPGVQVSAQHGAWITKPTCRHSANPCPAFLVAGISALIVMNRTIIPSEHFAMHVHRSFICADVWMLFIAVCKMLLLSSLMLRNNSFLAGTISLTTTPRCLPTPIAPSIHSSTPVSVPASDEVSLLSHFSIILARG